MRAIPALAATLLALLLAACGGGESQTTSPQSSAPAAAPKSAGDDRPAPDEAISGRPGGPGSSAQPDSADGDPFSEEAGGERRALEAAVRSYLSAIDRRDGFSVCQVLAPGALEEVRLPRRGGGCAREVSASIGHAEPGGPRWRSLRVDSVGPAELDPATPGLARVRATVVTLYRGGREPSIEDDLVYLKHAGTAWLVTKPSASFYRAIGARDVPLGALVAPR
jgi:hypothetical protein